MSKSEIEAELAFQLRAAGVAPALRDKEFLKGRKWRFDFQWSDRQLAVEVDGGTWPMRQPDGSWAVGRHLQGVGFENDCRKMNTAALMGWTVLRFTAAMVKEGEALRVIEAAISEQEGRP